MENDTKNRKWNRKLFSSEYQPTPEAKSKGWERRRIKQEIMDEMTRLDSMSMEELDLLRKDIETNPDKHTVREARLVRYMTREKFLLDYLDRNVGMPTQDIDIKSNEQPIKKYIFEIVNAKDSNEQSNNEGSESGESDALTD